MKDGVLAALAKGEYQCPLPTIDRSAAAATFEIVQNKEGD